MPFGEGSRASLDCLITRGLFQILTTRVETLAGDEFLKSRSQRKFNAILVDRPIVDHYKMGVVRVERSSFTIPCAGKTVCFGPLGKRQTENE